MVHISRWIVEYGGSQSLSVHVSSLDHKTKDSYCSRQSMYQMQVRTLCFALLAYHLPIHVRKYTTDL